MKIDNTKNKKDNTKNKKDNTKTTDNSEKIEISGAGDQAKNGSKLTDVLKKSIEVSGPIKTMGTALHTGLNLPNGTQEIFV